MAQRPARGVTSARSSAVAGAVFRLILVSKGSSRTRPGPALLPQAVVLADFVVENAALRHSPGASYLSPGPFSALKAPKIADFLVIYETHSYLVTYVFIERGLQNDNPSRRGSTEHIRDPVQLSATGGAKYNKYAPFSSHSPSIHGTYRAIHTPRGPILGPLRPFWAYSSRRAREGRMRAARRAGKAQATRVTLKAKPTIARTSPSSTRKGTESMK